MEVQKFPPSPNWYLSDILCSGPNGTVIYGSRNTLVIAKFEDKLFENTSFPDFETIDPAHKERVTTVRFCPNKRSKYSSYFTSGGDDSVVKLWNLSTLSPVMVNFAHGDGKKIITMDWTWGSSSYVISVDDSGLIVSWDLEKNITSKINVAKLLQAKKNVMLKANAGKLLPLVVKCCPHQDDLVAVGMKGGLVCLLTLRDSGRILHCMRGHDKDITSMSWCPVAENVLGGKDDADQDKAFLLATVCRDRNVFLWRCIDGHYLRTIKLPNTFLGRNSRLPASGTYVTLDWPTKETLICSSNYGEIIRFDLSPRGRGLTDVDALKTDTPNQPKSEWCLVHDIHPRCVFAVHCAMYTKKAGEGEDGKRTPIVWTTAQDRHLVAVSLDDGKVLVNIPTIGGFVYCLAASPFDPSRIAAGIGDFSIRLWNTGNSKEVQMTTLWQKIKGKVMAIAWHPTHELKLAFGTHEGRVGLQDISPGRLPVIFVPRHQHAVYALSWGPPCYKEGASENLPQFCLYSCGDGEILLHNPDAPEKEPRRMILLMKQDEAVSNRKANTCTDVAWKPDYSLLAVGNNDGTVQLFAPPYLKLVYTLYAHRKLLMTLVWHPTATSSDTSLSPMCHCLATGSNENVIHVYDLKNLCKAVADGVTYSNPIQSIAKLSGHQKKVVRLSWSPHSSGRLCSASYDNTIRVWDVIHQTCLACFMGHSGAGLACIWSSFDPDIIISGSTDFTLCSWRISTAKHVPRPTTGATVKKKPPSNAPLPVENEKHEKSSTDTVSSVPMAKSSKDVESTKASFTWRGSLFPISWKVAGGVGMIDGVRQLLEREEKGAGDGAIDPKLQFFGDRDDMYDLLKREEDHHISQDNLEQAQLMALWRGNVADMVKDAIVKGNLSDWLVSMAPAASYKLWLEACQAYSEQLSAKGKYNHAATYLLACHKVDDAIKLLRSRSLYREALAIARCRLAADDPTAREISVEWGRNLFTKGNYEVAAMCFTAAGEYLEAARALASRTSILECIAMAATLALKAGDEGKHLAHVLTMQGMHSNLQNNSWDAAIESIKPVKEFKSLCLVVKFHQRLVKGLEGHEKAEDDLLRDWIAGGRDEGSCEHLLQLPSSDLPWNDDPEMSADDAYTLISNHRGDKVTDPIKNFFVEMAEELALSICAASSGGELNAKKWNHLLRAMALCYSQQLTGSASGETGKHCLLKFCKLLSPNGPAGIEQLFDKLSVGDSPAVGFTKSAKAYVVFASVTWAEEKWVGEECDWPWSQLASFLVSHLQDILDPLTGEYFKSEVEVRKVEQELIKAKAKLKMVGENSAPRPQDKTVVVCESAANMQECSSKENGTMDGGCGDVGDIGEGLKAMTITESSGSNVLEETIKEKEAEIAGIRERREGFEKSRISAPNPFICFFKLRNVCDMMVKSCASEENSLPSDIQRLKEEVANGIVF
ncbi:gem-associated protein 5-like [Ischnura elegans]|uniref:gem-associated protein 5-like n=1 Tax=Ischnura elegans TaxID=197161 RepID=UPI001ED878CC|nr:gem-associated protein 5-like [Ischnura elegans]